MYKLLIADDDEIICRGLGECINWQEQGIEVIDMVYDGERALEVVREKQPDIVIADINMPFMDGMEFSCIVRQEFPWIKIILLTAYKEFDYARRAIQMQVFEYLTKPFENMEVLEAVKRAVASLEEERQYKEEIKRNLQIIREKYLAELLLYGKAECSQEIRLVNSQESIFQIAIFYIQYFYDQSDQELENMLQREVSFKIGALQIREYVEHHRGLNCMFQNNRAILLYEEGYEETSFSRCLKEIMGILSQNTNAYVVCGVGEKYQGMSRIPYTYEEADKVIENRYEYGNQSIVDYRDIPKNKVEYAFQFRLLSDTMQEAVKNRDEKELRKQLTNLLEKIGCMDKVNQSSLGLMVLELLLLSYKAFEDEKLYEKFFQNSGGLLGRIIKAKNRHELSKIVQDSFEIMFEYLKETNTSENEKLVQRALIYIRENYAVPDLSFKAVADSVSLSTSYLSVLMKKYGNINYNQYLNEVRIENAKRLLHSSNMKTYEVAFYVGFNSSQYFSSIFKKMMGMTPKEYRETYVKT